MVQRIGHSELAFFTGRPIKTNRGLRVQLLPGHPQSITIFAPAHAEGTTTKYFGNAGLRTNWRSLVSCFDHRLLLQDERAAHEAVKHMLESQPENRTEVARLQKL